MMTGVTVETILKEIGQLSAPDRARLYKILATGGLSHGGNTTDSQE